MRRIFLPVLACLAAVATSAAATDNPQNIVIILADDLAYADLGYIYDQQSYPTANRVPTPNIDSLKARGVNFTNAYSTSGLCAPSRAGLLTGQHQCRWGEEGNDNQEVPLSRKTLGDRMKTLGYATGMVGKWHLRNDDAVAKETLPTYRGFDMVFHPDWNACYFGAPILDSRINRDAILPNADARRDWVAATSTTPEPQYTTTMNVDRACAFIREQSDAAKPFFLYVAPNNAHGATIPGVNYSMTDYPYKYVSQAYLDRVPKTISSVGNKERTVMAAMLIALDDGVGKIESALRENLTVNHNTMLVFANDNGAYQHYIDSKAGVSPFSGGKSTVYEGGLRVPLIIRWPAGLMAQKGTTYSKQVSLLDLYPTAIAAAGGTVDPSWNLDGVNLRPAVTGETTAEPHPNLYWRMGDKQAMRQGKWKYMSTIYGESLFNLETDRGERTNVASANPVKLAELRELWKAWSASMAPAIVTHPVAVAVDEGQKATFTVKAYGSGAEEIRYQWFRNNIKIDNAVQASYVIQTALVVDNGAVFRVEVSTSKGTGSSRAAKLTVKVPVSKSALAQLDAGSANGADVFAGCK